jgi:hypothetical protein
MAEPASLERLSVFRHQECQLIARMQFDLPRQAGQDRDIERNIGLLPPHRQHTVLDVLPPHAHDIRFRVPSLQQQFQRQPGLGTCGVAILVLRDFVLCPSVNAPRFFFLLSFTPMNGSNDIKRCDRQ